MDAYYAVRTNWQDCQAEEDPILMCLASDVKRLEADHAALVRLVEEWADARVEWMKPGGGNYLRLKEAEEALLQWRQGRAD